MERRDFLKLGGLGTLAVAGLALPIGGTAQAKAASQLADRNVPRPYRAAFVRTKTLLPTSTTRDAEGVLTANYEVTAMRSSAAIVPGLTTTVFGYNGMFPGPTIEVQQGVRSRLRVRNALPAVNPLSGRAFNLSTHLHGSASLPQFDGYANDLTRVGEYKDYHYPNHQEARTLWYHDHAVHGTATSVYAGLAAQYRLHDELERGQLPQDEFDVGLLVGDAMFAANGNLAYDDRSHSGLWGDVVLVNGVPWPTMKVKRRVYRFRILVSSISRSYRFALSTREPLHIVATDGGLLEVPQSVASFRQASAERYEVLVDFRRYAPGTFVELLNLGNDNNVDYRNTGKVMRFEVTDAAVGGDVGSIPARLDVGPETRDTMALTAQMAQRTTRLRVQRDDATDVWQVNGRSWADVIASQFREVVASPAIGDVELWEFENKGGGWFHPMHVHLVDFKVVGRNTNGGQPYAWERGPKDVVYVGENETVSLLMRFTLRPGETGGRYMVHCHNLPHEDHDMMVQFRVGDNDPDDDPNDPIAAARAVPDDLPPGSPVYAPTSAPAGW